MGSSNKFYYQQISSAKQKKNRFAEHLNNPVFVPKYATNKAPQL